MNEYENAGPADCWEAYADTDMVRDFASRPGAIIALPYKSAAFPPVYENLGDFSYTDLYQESDLQWFDPASDFGKGLTKGSLVKHLYTGHVYAYVQDVGTLSVANYEVIDGKYTRIRTGHAENWTRVKVNTGGTRVGGIPLFDSSEWPHYQDKPLKFLGQYQLPSGEYIKIFFDYEMMCLPDPEENFAYVEGGPVPEWLELKPLSGRVEDWCEYPNIAFSYVPNKSGVKITPQWANEFIPEDRNYKFLMQFGFCSLPSFPTGDEEMDNFMCGDCGDWYLYYNPLTRKAWMTSQSK